MELNNALSLLDPPSPQVEFIRLQWIDYSGVLRVRIVSLDTARLLHYEGHQYSLAQNCLIIPVSTAPRCFPDGIEDWKLIPDWSSLRRCGYKPTYASVMCSTHHMGLERPSARCPRSLLYDVLDHMKQSEGLYARVGFELEFSFLDQDYNLARDMDASIGYSTSAGLRGRHFDIMDEVMAALKVSGISIYHFHVEMADQYEIALSPLPPMEAIDALMTTQETIKHIALRYGMRASLSPKPVLGGHGPKNGLHAHLSLHPLPVYEMYFLAGMLNKVRQLCAFGLANYDSYERVAGDCAGEWIAFGTGNKDLPIRRVGDGRWELRFLDATANVYLFVAAVLSAGVEAIRMRDIKGAESNGIQNGVTSVDRIVNQMRDCQVVPSALSDEEAKEQLSKYGVTERMPKSLKESLDAVRNDADMKTLLGEDLLTQYVRVKDKEVEYFAQMGREQRRIKLLQYF